MTCHDHEASRFGRILLAIALLSGLALMIPLFTAGPVTLDEHGSYWIIDSDLPGSSLDRSLNYAAIPPLSGWLQQASLSIFGHSEWAFRLPSAVCYWLAIIVTYLAAKRLSGETRAGLAAVILAWHPEAMDEVRIARCYGLLLLISAMLLWMTILWRERPRSLVIAVAWGLTGSALLWCHVVAAPLIAMAWGCLALPIPGLRLPERPSLIGLAIGTAIIVVGAAPLVPFIERLWIWSPFLNFMSGTTPIWKIIGPLWWLSLPVACGIVWGFSLWTPQVPEQPSLRSSRCLLAGMTMIPVVAFAVLASGDRASLASPRYRVPYASGEACLLAACLPKRMTTWGACLGVVIGMAATWSVADRSPWQPGRLNGHSDSEWHQMSQLIQKQGQTGEPIFVQSGLTESGLVPVLHDDRLFLEYVACRISRFYVSTTHPRIGLPYIWESRTGVVDSFREHLALSRDSSSPFVWVACATDTDLNLESLTGIRSLLESQGFRQSDEWPFETAVLLRFRR